MPRHRVGIAPMPPAERQARRRARLRRENNAAPAPPTQAPAKHQRVPPRPRRWVAAVAALVALQDEYRAWLDNRPENLHEAAIETEKWSGFTVSSPSPRSPVARARACRVVDHRCARRVGMRRPASAEPIRHRE